MWKQVLDHTSKLEIREEGVKKNNLNSFIQSVLMQDVFKLSKFERCNIIMTI